MVIFLWAAVCALEVSPDLHALLHKDAQSPDHHCLVTQLQHHALLSGFVAAVAPVPPERSDAPARCADAQFRLSCDYRLTPSRAPPAL